MPYPELTTVLASLLAVRPETLAIRPVAGGDIATSLQLATNRGEAYFLKLMPAGSGVLAAEAEGLAALAATDTLRTPQVIGHGSCGEGDWLLLQWLALSDWQAVAPRFAEQLARLHLAPAGQPGWSRDNFIGLSRQPNPPARDWVTFFRDARLGHQLRWACERGLERRARTPLGHLCERLDAFFDAPVSLSLLHGDLWTGNVAACDGEPVIFDPAVYYGHHEADLAMLELFGSPGEAFFEAYQRLLPIDSGYRLRRDLYNLYHLLNHFNLFGGGYGERAGRVAQRLLAEIR